MLNRLFGLCLAALVATTPALADPAQQYVISNSKLTPVGDGTASSVPLPIGGGGGACAAIGNPTAVAGPAAINGSSTNCLASDSAPAVQKGSNAQFGIVEGDGTTINCVAGVCATVSPSGNVIISPATGNTANDAVVMSNTATGVKDAGFAPAPAGHTAIVTTSQTPNATDWGACKQFILNNSGLSVTVPASSTLQADGGCYEIQTLANAGSLIANAADTTTFPGGTTSGTGATTALPANKLFRVSTNGAGNLIVSENTVTGTGSDVRQVSPALTTPSLGAATATSINGNTVPSASDTVALLGARQTFTGEDTNAPAALTIATTTFTPDGSKNNYYIHLTAACAAAACTLANPSAGFAASGLSGVIEVQQPASGGPACFGTYGSRYIYQGTTATIACSTGASASDLWSFYVRNDLQIVLTTASLNPTH